MDNRKFQAASSASPPAVEASPSTGYPTDGNPSTATPATIPGARWFHQVGEELRNVINTAGLTPSDSDLTQLLQALRGNGVFTTPAQFDNTTKAATTAFVQRALGSMQASVQLTANTTLTAAAVGKNIQPTVAGITLTLPVSNTTPLGSKISFINVTGGAVTIQRGGSDGINLLGAFHTTFSLPRNETITLINCDSGGWFGIDGTFLNKTAADFGSSLTANGYQKLPGGMIIQWVTSGTITAGSSSAITLPIAFPNGILGNAGVVATSTASTTPIGIGIANTSSSQITIYNRGATNDPFRAIIIGW